MRTLYGIFSNPLPTKLIEPSVCRVPTHSLPNMLEDFTWIEPVSGPSQKVIVYVGLSGSAEVPYHSSSSTCPGVSQRHCRR